jgi:prepilin-type N-terminal cleavage/methylation domain-containing protein
MIKTVNTLRRGFTMVELLIALAITAILLAAVATAFNASVVSYQENESMFKSANSARQALFRITAQLRTADAVDTLADANEVSMVTAEGDDITYRYNSGDQKLYLITNDDTTDSDYVLCDNVRAMTFTKQTGLVDGTLCVKSVVILITTASGNNEKNLSAAAVIRRNLR